MDITGQIRTATQAATEAALGHDYDATYTEYLQWAITDAPEPEARADAELELELEL